MQRGENRVDGGRAANAEPPTVNETWDGWPMAGWAERENRLSFSRDEEAFLSTATESPASRRLTADIRNCNSFILVHFFPEGPLKRCNSLNTHISRIRQISYQKR
jgi:hypothetical protein